MTHLGALVPLCTLGAPASFRGPMDAKEPWALLNRSCDEPNSHHLEPPRVHFVITLGRGGNADTSALIVSTSYLPCIGGRVLENEECISPCKNYSRYASLSAPGSVTGKSPHTLNLETGYRWDFSYVTPFGRFCFAGAGLWGCNDNQFNSHAYNANS